MSRISRKCPGWDSFLGKHKEHFETLCSFRDLRGSRWHFRKCQADQRKDSYELTGSLCTKTIYFENIKVRWWVVSVMHFANTTKALKFTHNYATGLYWTHTSLRLIGVCFRRVLMAALQHVTLVFSFIICIQSKACVHKMGSFPTLSRVNWYSGSHP